MSAATSASISDAASPGTCRSKSGSPLHVRPCTSTTAARGFAGRLAWTEIAWPSSAVTLRCCSVGAARGTSAAVGAAIGVGGDTVTGASVGPWVATATGSLAQAASRAHAHLPHAPGRNAPVPPVRPGPACRT
jgi:hypothetical protein